MLVLNDTLPVQAATSDERLTVISYNVESDDVDDTDPTKVAEDIQRIAGADVWGLSEVANQEAADIFTQAVTVPSSSYTSILGTTGSNDKLQLIFNRNRLRLISSEELNGSGGTREPLVGRFEFLPNGQEFLFMVNHFNRREAEKRQKQAQFVREWGKQQTLPIIAVGDYNFDVDPRNKSGNAAFEIFNQDDTFAWIEPQCLSTDTCPPTGSQCDPQYNSILDFVFVTGAAKQWQGESDLLFLEEEVCPKEESGYSDHRPVSATFRVNSSSEIDGGVTDTGSLPSDARVRIASLLPNPAGDLNTEAP